MPDAKDYKRAMDKVTAGQRWKDATLEKMRAETAAPTAGRPRRTIPFGRRAIPLATAAALCLLVIPAAVRGFAPVSGGAAQDAATPRMATARQMPESSAAVAPYALDAAPEEAGAGTSIPAYTLVDADSPEAALPADAQPADDAAGRSAALDLLAETLSAEGEGRTPSDVLASGLMPDGAFAFVLAQPGEAGCYRLYLIPAAG